MSIWRIHLYVSKLPQRGLTIYAPDGISWKHKNTAQKTFACFAQLQIAVNGFSINLQPANVDHLA